MTMPPCRIATLAFVATCTLLALANPAFASSAADATCQSGHAKLHVAVTGLKDRTGRLRLELYPAVEADFLKSDKALEREGKVFRRIAIPVPPAGPITLCIAVPTSGSYALIVVHDRHGGAKFSVVQDGVGVPGHATIGRSRPKLAQAIVTVTNGVGRATIRLQYLRGLAGFAPMPL